MEPILQLFQSLYWPLIFATLILPLSVASLAVKRNQEKGIISDWLARSVYAWCKIVLDISLVWGIALACIGLIGMTLNLNLEERGDGLSESVVVVFSVMVTAGLAAVLAFTFERENTQIPMRLSLWQITLVNVFMWYITMYLMADTGIRFMGGHFHPIITTFQLALIALLTLISSLINSTPWQQTLFKANLGVTLFLMALAIVSWFLNWSDFENSQQSTYLIANVLMWGSLVHVNFYFFVMATEKQPDAKLRIKTWHFTEAFAFFAFLVYAPIGTTEYFRESADQDALQEQHENQQSEIDYLKAEIEELKRQIST